MPSRQGSFAILFFLLFTLITSPLISRAQSGDVASVTQDALTTYADIVHASYEDSYMAAIELQTAVDDFLAEPTEESLQAARDAWLAAREPYGQTEAFRFYGGPIDGEDGPEGLINAWPLDEVYIDYVEGMPDAGIINNTDDYPEITPELLESLNEVGAEENISVGFHAIEFLLWGQDLSEDSAGNRPYTDYTTAPNADRRAAYLDITSDLLVQHLESLEMAWSSDNEDNYRAEFLEMEPDIALGNMLTGIGVLSKSELAGERIFTAYDNQDQEDEHSCFSDNTHRDIVTNIQGIANVYRGEYTRVDGTLVDGTGLDNVVAEIDAELNDTILAQLDAVVTMADDLYVPFDQAIVLPESRDAVLELVFSLQDLGDLFAQTASELDITINTASPE